MASACIDVHARPIHVNIHMYTRLMHVHVRICTCTCMSHIHIHVHTYMYMHLPCTCTVHIQEYMLELYHGGAWFMVYTSGAVSIEHEGVARSIVNRSHECVP